MANSNQLIDVPVRSHGIENFTALIMLNLSQPSALLTDLESALKGLKQSFSNNHTDLELKKVRSKMMDENLKYGEHPDINTLEIMPCPIVIVGGMFDIFQDFGNTHCYQASKEIPNSSRPFSDPEIKKHVCRFLRSVAHTLGAALIFYSTKNSALSKILRDQLSNSAFGSPQNPIRMHKTDYNEPIIIEKLSDSWEQIGVLPSNSERIAITFSSQIQQQNKSDEKEISDPSKDPNFSETIIDELRSRKDEELFRLIKNSEMKIKFDSFNLTNSPFNYLN